MANDKVTLKYLTDEEICMLEQLTYLSEDVTKKAGIIDDLYRINSKHIQQSVHDILISFNDTALTNLRSHSEAIDPYKISGVEWADIIDYLKTSRLKDLYLTDIMFNNDNFNTYIEKEDKDNNTKEYISIKNDVITDDLRKKQLKIIFSHLFIIK